ncbi:Golgi membrane exchange factor (Ric1p-Rgp1p) subunit [Balamuthia mandrillaris]
MTLPTDIPPTIQGTGLRVNYWFTISAQRPKSKTFSCRLPFRVHHPAVQSAVFKRMKLQGWSCKEPPLVESMELEACSIPFADTTLPFQEEWEHERRTLTSPFYSPTFSSSSASSSPLASPLLLSGSGTDNYEGQYQQSLAAQELAVYFQTVAALRNELSVPETFNICKGRYHLCRVNITKRAFTFGDTIEGVIDFSSANIPCYQVSLLLQNLEEIDPSVVHPSRSNWRVRRTHGEHHHLTLNTRLLPFSFTLPLAATQELLSDILCVSWVLHFEFVTTPPPVDLQVVSSSATPKEEEEEIIKTTTTVTGDEAKDQHHLKPQPQEREKGKAMNYVVADSGQPKQPPKNIVQVVVARTPQQGEVTRWDLALRLLCWERQQQSSHGNSLLGRSPGGEVFSDLRHLIWQNFLKEGIVILQRAGDLVFPFGWFGRACPIRSTLKK